MSGISRQECEKLRERLPEHADGSLAGPERVRIEAHLGRCPRCAAEVEDLRAMLRAVHSVTPDEVPDDLLRRVREAVRARPPAPAGLPRLLPRIAVPVALAVGVIAIGFALRAPRERARMAAAPQSAMAQEERLATTAGAARAGARGGGARGGAGRGGGRAAGGRAAGGRAAGDRAAGGRSARGPVVVAEATEEARGDRALHSGGMDLGWEKPAEPQDSAAERAPEPKETDALYADLDLADATAAQPAPGPSGPLAPPDTPETASAGKLDSRLEREGTAGEGMGGIAGGGALFRSAGPRDAPGSGAPLAEKRSPRSGPPHKGAAREGDAGTTPLRKMMVRDDRVQAGAAPGETKDAPIPPLSATLGLGQYEGRPALTVQLASDKPVAEMSVYLGDPADRRLVWQGSSPSAVPLVLTPEHIGPAPAATPIAIEAGEESRNYLLFTPTLARLGEVAQTAPTGAYAGESISQALAELTALTGLVVLAEEPLCQVLSGDKPGGAPEAALRELAARAGLEVERAGDVVFNLKHPR